MMGLIVWDMPVTLNFREMERKPLPWKEAWGSESKNSSEWSITAFVENGNIF